MTDDLALAAALVRDAGRLAADMALDGLQTTHKTSRSDVVSAADHAAEELIVARLRAARPDDGIIGEEGADHSTRSGRTWYVDPVDGTYNFLSGLPTWCSAVALADDDGPLLAAVYQPATEELWLGGREHPTTCNDIAVPRLTDRPLAELSLASYLHPSTLPDDRARIPLLRVLQGAATVRMLGSGSIELAAVAAGRLGVWAQLDSLDWDWLPGACLVRAAGGQTQVLTAGGHRWHIAGPARAVADVVAALRGAHGLAARAHALTNSAAERVRGTGHVQVDGPVDELPGAITDVVEAVLTEALENAVRHAYCGTIWVDVSCDAELVTVLIRDDGVGPNDEPIDAQPTGAGLRRMAEWAAALGGECSIEPNDPLGARLRWAVPRR